MSILYSEAGARYVDELAASKGVPLGSGADVGFFDGSLSAPIKGLMRGVVAKPTKLVTDSAAQFVRPAARQLDKSLGTDAFSNFVESQVRKSNRFLEDLKADPVTTGTAGQVLHGFFDVGSSALLFTPVVGWCTRQTKGLVIK